MKTNKKSKLHFRKKTLLFLLVLVVLFTSLFTAYRLTRPSMESLLVDQDAKTTSEALTAQENFSEGTARDPGNSVNENEGSGLVNDNQGVVSSVGDKSNWIKSTGGEITVYSPTSNSEVVSGSEISGESVLPSVSFRIIDNVSGVISEGQLVVKSGRFSGSLDFTTSASEGRIDIFAVEQDGREYSNIEIPVKLR